MMAQVEKTRHLREELIIIIFIIIIIIITTQLLLLHNYISLKVIITKAESKLILYACLQTVAQTIY